MHRQCRLALWWYLFPKKCNLLLLLLLLEQSSAQNTYIKQPMGCCSHSGTGVWLPLVAGGYALHAATGGEHVLWLCHKHFTNHDRKYIVVKSERKPILSFQKDDILGPFEAHVFNNYSLNRAVHIHTHCVLSLLAAQCNNWNIFAHMFYMRNTRARAHTLSFTLFRSVACARAFVIRNVQQQQQKE